MLRSDYQGLHATGILRHEGKDLVVDINPNDLQAGSFQQAQLLVVVRGEDAKEAQRLLGQQVDVCFYGASRYGGGLLPEASPVYLARPGSVRSAAVVEIARCGAA